MVSFQQTCPSCARSLQLPIEAKGELAVCPACDTQFVAGESAQEAGEDQDVSSTETATRTRCQSVAIEAVVAEARAVFSTRELPLLVPFLLPSILLLVGFVVPLAYLSELGATNQTLALTILAVLAPVLLIPVAYAFWVAMNLANRILDHHPQDSENGRDDTPDHNRDQSHWAKPSLRRFAAVYAVTFVSCVLMCGLGIVSGMLLNIAQSIAVPEVRFVAMAFAFLLGIIAFVATMTRFWPVFPLSMQGIRLRGLVRESLRVSGANLMTSFFLVALICALLGLGFCFFGLGLPIAIPYSAMLVTVGYRMICKIPIRAMENR